MGSNALNGAAPDWTDARSNAAMMLWRRGEPARYIGSVVGKSKNAVIGHAHRQGWGPHPRGHDPRHGA